MNIIDIVKENFADGKVKGKSRFRQSKRAGASCKRIRVPFTQKKAKTHQENVLKCNSLVCPT